MVQVKCNHEQGKCFHMAAPDLGIVEHSSASPSPFPSSTPSFGFNTTAAATSSSFASPFTTSNAPSFGSIAPPSFGTSFPWSSNTSSSAANINSSVQNPPKAATFEFPVNGNSPSAFFRDNANIANTTTTTRSCSCGGKSNNPPSENNISSNPSPSAPLFGPASVLPENTKFLAPQETQYPFQVSPFEQFPWNGSTAPASTQFPWSNNTSSAAANNNTCIFSSHGNAKNRSCACVGSLYNPSSGNNINSSVQNPLKASTFELPITGNSSSAFSGDHATVVNAATTRSCSCDRKSNNPPSENNISTTRSVSSPLFGVPPVTSSFLAPQETPNPFQVPNFTQFPWSGSSKTLPFYAAIPSNNYYNGFTSPYGVPSSANDKYCTCCCKCNKANGEPKQGFTTVSSSSNNNGEEAKNQLLQQSLQLLEQQIRCSKRAVEGAEKLISRLKPAVGHQSVEGITWNNFQGNSSSNNSNTIPSFKFATPWDVHSPFLVKNKQPCECKYRETVIECGEKLMSIAAMPSVGNQSVEELRWNNYHSQGTATRDGNGSGDKENVGCGIQ